MTNALPALDSLSSPSHTCLIYHDLNQQIETTAEFLRIGLGRGEKCLFLEMPGKLEQVRKRLASQGIDVEEAEKQGALLLSAHRDYLDHGRFNAERTLGFLNDAVQDTLAHGFSALRATGDMNWELGADQDFHLLLGYEAALDKFVMERPIVGMCQYQRYTVSSSAICNALETHECVVLGEQFCNDNLYYEPPEIKLEADPARREQRRGEWMCRQLTALSPQPLHERIKKSA